MKIAANLGRRIAAISSLAFILDGCAAPIVPVVTASQTPIIPARLHQGVVVGIRRIDLPGAASTGAAGAGATGASGGVNAVLAALREPAVSTGISAQEIVVAETGGTAVSLVEQHVAPPGFAVGDHVTIAEGGTTALVRGN